MSIEGIEAHLPLELRFDDLPLGRCSIFDAKGYSLVADVRRDIARDLITAVNERDHLLEENKVLRAACKRAALDFDILITRGDIADEPRAHQTLKILRAALGRKGE